MEVVWLDFSEERIRNGAKKILKAKKSSTQGRLDSFFKVLPSNKPIKRKVSEHIPINSIALEYGTELVYPTLLNTNKISLS